MAEIGCNWAKIGPSKSNPLHTLLGLKKAEIGCNWAKIGPSKSSQSLSNAHKWAADSLVLTLTLAFLDFGLDFAQSFPFHAQFCHFGLVFCLFVDIHFLHNTNAKQTYIWQFLSVFGHLSSFLK
ncbi:hypothetical protein Tco_0243894, partial [Tanacetum coccineum]